MAVFHLFASKKVNLKGQHHSQQQQPQLPLKQHHQMKQLMTPKKIEKKIKSSHIITMKSKTNQRKFK